MIFIINNLSKIIIHITIFLIIYILIRLLYIKIYNKKTILNQEILKLLFWTYLYSIITITILISLPKDLSSLFPLDFKGNINTTTFLVVTHTINSIKHGNYQYILINVLGNIVAFIPLGILLPIIYGKKGLFNVLIYGFTFSFFIEIIQSLLFRATDVDDIMLNTLGTLIGYFIYRFIIK
ncbi:MAG: VanZ family protein [Erysipelotrichaceae bacterium]|nr:VanZ family protein [Erysipelotrichaceae bacterium]